jgi:PIN domain nuclease of toxin-antitoxin system
LRVLLDTHVLLWSFFAPERIGGEAARAFRDPATTPVVSVATFWEIAIKRAMDKLTVPDDFPDRVRALGHEILPIRTQHAWRAGGLPNHHRDPFDRLLIAQAQVEGLMLATHDRQMLAYDAKVLLA